MARTGAVETPPVSSPAPDVPVVPDRGFRGSRIVKCRRCKAEVGSPCRRPSGHVFGRGGFMDEAHAERQRDACQVRIEGLYCSDCRRPDGPGQFVAPVQDGEKAHALGIVGREICGTCAERYREAPDRPPA